MNRRFQLGFTILFHQTNLAHASTASFQFDDLCVYMLGAGVQWRRVGRKSGERFLEKTSLEHLETE